MYASIGLRLSHVCVTIVIRITKHSEEKCIIEMLHLMHTHYKCADKQHILPLPLLSGTQVVIVGHMSQGHDKHFIILGLYTNRQQLSPSLVWYTSCDSRSSESGS